MTMKHISFRRELLDNYRDLVGKVDHLCRGIETEFRAHLACCDGCDSCCRHLSLFPVEAVALAAALDDLPDNDAERIRERVRDGGDQPNCPLLENSHCLLYAARPIICRTHGLPLLTIREEGRHVDFCPLNFQGVGSLPGSAVIDLDRLNTALATVNRLFVAEYRGDSSPEMERITIAEALRIEL
jgi:uncharacterized protein